MDTLSTLVDAVAGRPVLRAGLAAVAAVGLVVMPFDAMDANPLKGGDGARHVTEYNEECSGGCNTYDEICCNDPIG